MYRLSTWSHCFFRENVAALYHALTMEVVYLPRASGEAILHGGRDVCSLDIWSEEVGEALPYLIEKRFLVAPDNHDYSELESQRVALAANQPLDVMYLLVTDGCNLRCTYCFEESPGAPKFRARQMDESTVDAAIDTFARLTGQYGSVNPEKLIQLYGGEPLMNKKAIRRAVRRLAERKESGDLSSETKLVILTNGLLLDEEFAQYLATEKVALGISLDGPALYTNTYRIAKKKGVDTFVGARRAYEIARAAGIEVGLSATLTPDVVAHFDEVLDFFINDLRVESGINFNILHFSPAAPVDDEYYDRAADCILLAFERFRDLGIYEERMMRKVQSFADQDPIFVDCGVSGNQIIVAPDGAIGVCQDFVKPRTYFHGSVHDKGDPIASGLHAEWRTRSPFYIDGCQSCPAIAICGGGCPASVELSTGNRWNIDRRICPHSRKSLEWLIWETYATTVV